MDFKGNGKRFYISSKKDPKSIQLLKIMRSALVGLGFVFDSDSPEIVISIGGDGTFLRLVQRWYKIDPLFVSINMGNLGYLCEYKGSEMKLLLADILDPKIREISLLECDFNTGSVYALNEVRIEAKGGQSIRFDVSINDNYLETIRADGCCVSTSIGSSGMARSLGGSLVDNEIEMLEFVEKAAIRNRSYSSIESPFVLNKDKTIKLSNFSFDSFNIFYDCKGMMVNDFKGCIAIFLSDKKVKVLQNPRNNYILKTKEAFVG
jgi:NAD+ kinase